MIWLSFSHAFGYKVNVCKIQLETQFLLLDYGSEIDLVTTSAKMSDNFELLQLFREVGEKQLAQQAFDRARSIDPSLALPWAGMSADMYTR